MDAFEQKYSALSVNYCPISSQLAESVAAVISAKPVHVFFTNTSQPTAEQVEFSNDTIAGFQLHGNAVVLCLLKYLLNKAGK